MPKLNQIVAVEKGVKSRVYEELTAAHKIFQKPQIFEGHVKTYERKTEDGEDYPQDRQVVQFRVEDILRKTRKQLGELIDLTATKDVANTKALADIVVDGHTLASQIPATHLLFLEKQLTDLRTIIGTMPTLDDAENWRFDDVAGLHKTSPISTHRTKKVQRPIVLYDATEHHPAQTQLITDDVVVGHWNTEKHSGAVTAARKQVLLERVEKLLVAVKFAREQANLVDAEKMNIGENLLGFIFE